MIMMTNIFEGWEGSNESRAISESLLWCLEWGMLDGIFGALCFA
jgi:hypothetical protein